jgi:hypothetical protein
MWSGSGGAWWRSSTLNYADTPRPTNGWETNNGHSSLPPFALPFSTPLLVFTTSAPGVLSFFALMGYDHRIMQPVFCQSKPFLVDAGLWDPDGSPPPCRYGFPCQETSADLRKMTALLRRPLLPCTVVYAEISSDIFRQLHQGQEKLSRDFRDFSAKKPRN